MSQDVTADRERAGERAGVRDGERDRERVAATLERLEAGVRQRRAELATLGERSEELRLALVELRRHEVVEEPPCVSPRPVIGPLLVFLRKAGFHLFVKWWVRPVLQQQNAFHQLAGGRIQALTHALEEVEHRVARLTQRLDRLEGEPEGEPSGETGGEPGDGSEGEPGVRK